MAAAEKIVYLEELIKSQTTSFSREMHANVRKAISQLKTSQKQDTIDMKEVTETVTSMMQHKADFDRVLKLEDQKSNKVDVDICLRWVDLLHKMVK